jgi:small subunit ribosomal protein S6
MSNRNYRATFILDNRGKEDSAEQIIGSLKTEIAAVGATVGQIDNLGRRDFKRVTDTKFPGGNFVQIAFAGPATAPSALRERLRLNQNVYRTFVQSV